MPESSAGYLSQLESGSKVPSGEVATRLAERLGDPKDVFRLWSMTGRRYDPRSAAQARRMLAHIFDDPNLMFDERFTPAAMATLEESTSPSQPPDAGWQELPPLGAVADTSLDASHAAPPESARPWANAWSVQRMRLSRQEGDHALRIPLVPEGHLPEGPGDPLLQRCRYVRLEPEAIPAQRLLEPFAYRVSARSVRRVRDTIREGDIAVMTRETLPITRQEIYLLRHDHETIFARLIWNQAQLLVLPAPQDDDFFVTAAGPRQVREVVLARVATVVRDQPQIPSP